MLNLYKLDDDKWSGLKIGSSKFTVKEKGLTSLCSASCLGVDPINFITKMNVNNGYTKTGLIRWPNVASLFDANWISQDFGDKGANLPWIASLAVKGFPVIAELLDGKFVIILDPEFNSYDPTTDQQDKLADPEKSIRAVHCFQKVPGTTDYMGKNQEYWLKTEKDLDDSRKLVGNLTTEVHEFSNSLDAEKVKSKTLSDQYNDLLNKLASLLNVPAKPEEITKGIAEIMSKNDSLDKLSKEAMILKQGMASALANGSMFQHEANEMATRLNTTQATLTKTSTDLQKIVMDYNLLLTQTGGKPKIDLRLFGHNLKLY